MEKEEADKLVPGLYILIWDGGGHSIAAVGQRSGEIGNWFAPTNWIGSASIRQMIGMSDQWEEVKTAILIHKQYDLEIVGIVEKHLRMEQNMRWIRADIKPDLHAASLYIRERSIHILYPSYSLVNLLAEDPPETAIKLLTDIIADLRPELAGGQIWSLKYSYQNVWKCIYLHHSLPVWKDGGYPVAMPLDPTDQVIVELAQINNGEPLTPSQIYDEN